MDNLYDTIQNEQERCQMDGTGDEFDKGYYEGLSQCLEFIQDMQDDKNEK